MKALNTHLDAGVYTHQTTYLSKYQSDITIYIYTYATLPPKIRMQMCFKSKTQGKIRIGDNRKEYSYREEISQRLWNHILRKENEGKTETAE